MNDNMPTLHTLAAKNVKASQAPVCAMRVYAEVGTFASCRKLREVYASTASDTTGAGVVVCEGGE